MGVELTFAMSTESSASARVQSFLLPFADRFQNRWMEDGDRTFLVIRVPEPGVDQFVGEVQACHPTVVQVSQDPIEV